MDSLSPPEIFRLTFVLVLGNNRMPEPFTLFALGVGKLIAAHSAHAAAAHAAVGSAAAGTTAAGSGHIAAILFAGVAAGTTLYAICVCLKKLVEAKIFSQRQATQYKEKAEKASEPVREEMYRDAKALCDKYNL